MNLYLQTYPCWNVFFHCIIEKSGGDCLETTAEKELSSTGRGAGNEAN